MPISLNGTPLEYNKILYERKVIIIKKLENPEG
jgi:hypothetical protein